MTTVTPQTITTPTPSISAEEQVLINGEDFFESLIQDIHAAELSIDLETYIFENDLAGQRVAEALAAAAERGIAVRILVDGAGSPYWTTSFAKPLEKANVKTKVFHPFPWQFWNWSRSVTKKPFFLNTIHLLLKSNSRNHRKTCLIDNKIAYIGSVNITHCHFKKEAGGKNWRDTSIRLTHIDFSELRQAFEIAWTQRTIQERVRDIFKHIRGEPRIRLNYTRHRRRILHKNLLRRIRLCQRRIWITNAYFVPDNFLLKRLKEAARNGVDVRILLPKKSNQLIVEWASSTFYANLLKAGIKIYEYLPGMLHAKSLILDDWMLIGSSNLNHRSLLHDLEVDVTVFTEKAKKMLEQLFLNDLSHASEIKLDYWKLNHSLHRRILGRMALYLKYII